MLVVVEGSASNMEWLEKYEVAWEYLHIDKEGIGSGDMEVKTF